MWTINITTLLHVEPFIENELNPEQEKFLAWVLLVQFCISYLKQNDLVFISQFLKMLETVHRDIILYDT